MRGVVVVAEGIEEVELSVRGGLELVIHRLLLLELLLLKLELLLVRLLLDLLLQTRERRGCWLRRSSTVERRRAILLDGPLPLLLSSLRPRPRRASSRSLLRRRVAPTTSSSIRQRSRPSSVSSHVLLLLLLHGSELGRNEFVSLELPPSVSTAETRPSRDRPSDELPARTSRFVEGEEQSVFLFTPWKTLRKGESRRKEEKRRGKDRRGKEA